MKIDPRTRISSRFIPLLVSLFGVAMLSACGSEQFGPSLDEAYQVGYDAAVADNCRRHGPRPVMIPSAYDDSLEGGRLASAFQEGYSDGDRHGTTCE